VRDGRKDERTGGERGQALVEFALLAPLFLFVVFVALQIGLLMMMYFNVIQVTRETARWVAIRPNTTDANIRAQAIALMRPGMRAASYTSVTSTPPCASLDSFSRCPARAPGDVLTVEILYNASHVVFLPTEFHLLGGITRIPTQLPAYRVTVMME
jgi:Flp pilus assembly protein TadG